MLALCTDQAPVGAPLGGPIPLHRLAVATSHGRVAIGSARIGAPAPTPTRNSLTGSCCRRHIPRTYSVDFPRSTYVGAASVVSFSVDNHRLSRGAQPQRI
jgi:hypothetical protein